MQYMAILCIDLHKRALQAPAGRCAELPERGVRGQLLDTVDPAQQRADVLGPGDEGRHLIRWAQDRDTARDCLADRPLMFAAELCFVGGWCQHPLQCAVPGCTANHTVGARRNLECTTQPTLATAMQ